MKLTVAATNRKAGTGKTTSAVWVAHAFAERGPVLLVDADPAASALEWSDLAADEGGFPFRVIALPSKQLHQRLPDIAKPDEFVVIDTPQTEDHAAIAGSVMRIADEIGSRALRSDAIEAITCGYLSAILVLGLIVQLLMPGWWWVDSATSLVIVVLLVKEGHEAWEDKDEDENNDEDLSDDAERDG